MTELRINGRLGINADTTTSPFIVATPADWPADYDPTVVRADNPQGFSGFSIQDYLKREVGFIGYGNPLRTTHTNALVIGTTGTFCIPIVFKPGMNPLLHLGTDGRMRVMGGPGTVLQVLADGGAAEDTPLFLMIGGGGEVRRVKVGPPDSGSLGYRLLMVVN